MKKSFLALAFIAMGAHATGSHHGNPAPTPMPIDQTQNQQQQQGTNVSVQELGSKNSLWVLPGPVFTPPMPMTCPQANVEQRAMAIGWNFLSVARADSNSDNCTAIQIYNGYLAQCKYASAQQVMNLLSRKILPGFKDQDVTMLDLTSDQCEKLKAPMPKVEPTYQLVQLPKCEEPKRIAPRAKAAPKMCK